METQALTMTIAQRSALVHRFTALIAEQQAIVTVLSDNDLHITRKEIENATRKLGETLETLWNYQLQHDGSGGVSRHRHR